MNPISVHRQLEKAQCQQEKRNPRHVIEYTFHHKTFKFLHRMHVRGGMRGGQIRGLAIFHVPEEVVKGNGTEQEHSHWPSLLMYLLSH